MSVRAAWLPFVNDRRVASVRMRTYRAVHILRGEGEDVRVLQGGLPDPGEVLVLQKAYSPPHLQLAREHRAAGGAVVLDLCDNHFATSGSEPALAERSANLHAILPHVDLVSVCTNALGLVVPHPAVAAVNDALDPVHSVAATRRVAAVTRRHRRRVLWFGTAGAHNLPFGMRDLARVLPDLARAAGQTPFELVVVSDSRAAFNALERWPSLPMRYVPWRRSTFGLVASACDVAVLPVEINPITRGKTSNRVATALQHGLAVVTDPLPSYLAYETTVRMGDYGNNVTTYLGDAHLRTNDVAAGRRITQQLYAPGVIAMQWREVLDTAVRRREGF